MLPIVSWESRPLATPMGADTNNAVAADYTLANIINGQFDSYIDQWATDAKTLGLPIALRFNHEMNGYWYPWSEQANGNSPGEYVTGLAACARPVHRDRRDERRVDLVAQRDQRRQERSRCRCSIPATPTSTGPGCPATTAARSPARWRPSPTPSGRA